MNKQAMRTMLVVALIAVGWAGTAMSGPFDGWSNRITITFSGYNNAETLTNFPALVVFSNGMASGFDYGNFISHSNTDLRFTDASRTTELNYEVESTNNGAAFVWVQIPKLSTSNDCIWAYWGQTNVSAPVYTTNGAAWDANYRAVWHLNGTKDSTANANTLTTDTTTNVPVGMIAQARGFKGSTYMSAPNSASLQVTNFLTLEAWVYSTNWTLNTGAHNIVAKYAQDGYRWRIDTPTNTELWALAATDNGSTFDLPAASFTFNLNSWYYVATTIDKTAMKAYLYVNGNQIGSPVTLTKSGTIYKNTNPLYLGSTGGGGEYWNGALDEVRISGGSAVRSTNWLWASYQTVASNGVFESYSGMNPALDNATLVTQAPTNITTTSAYLNGYLSATGTSATAVYLYWGASDAGTNAAAWGGTNAVWAAPQAPGGYSTNVTGLAPNQGWCYRYAASNNAGLVWGSAASFIAAPVAITTSSNTSEIGLTPGTFTVWRASSATGVAVTVSYAVTGGTASNGVDYATLSGSVAIPIGATNAAIVVMPLFDRIVEGTETVQVTLLSGSYLIGSPSNATMNLYDNPAAALPGLNLIWDNTSGNWNWDQASSNWHLSGTPNGSTYFLDGDSVTIGTPHGTINLNNQSRSVGGLVMGDDGADFTIGSSAGNGTLNVGAGGIVNNLQWRVPTFNCNIALTTNAMLQRTNSAGVNGIMTFNGSVDTAGYALTIDQQGNNTYNGNVKGAGNMVCLNGTVTFAASNALSGSVTAGGTVVVKGSAGSFLNASNVVIQSGGALTLGDTGSSFSDDGVTTFGRIKNTQAFSLNNATLRTIGQGTVTTERVSVVTLWGARSTLDVQSSTLVPASLVRDAESRPVAKILSGASYNLGNGGYLKSADGGAGQVPIGGDGSRTTNKKVVPYVHTLTTATTANEQNGSPSHPNSFVTWDTNNGFVQMNPTNDFVQGTSATAFPSVNADGNDNVRIDYNGISSTGGTFTVSLASDTAVNSLVFDSDYTNSGITSKSVTLTGPAGSTLTVKSGAIMGTPSTQNGDNHKVVLAVPTLALGGAEGVFNMYGRDGATMTISSAITGTNGLTLFHDGWTGSLLTLSGANSNLTGQITIGGSVSHIGSSVYALGSGSNDLFLTGTLTTDVGVSGGTSVTVRSIKGFGMLTAGINSPSFNVGGDGTGGAANTLTLTNNGTLSPGTSSQAGTLTLASFSSVKLKGGTVALDLFSTINYDRLALSGATALTITNASLQVALAFVPNVGDLFLAVNVAGSTAISGKFAQGDSLTAAFGSRKVTFDILYNSSLAGGDGNDIVLRVSEVGQLNPGTALFIW